MATLLAHVTVHPGTEKQFETIVSELHRRTHADEPEVLRYDWVRGAEPRTYYTFLSYPDHRTFIEHQVSDQHEEAAAQFRDMIASIRIEWVDPIGVSGDLPATETQEAPDDADELTKKYSERFAATVAEWWGPLR